MQVKVEIAVRACIGASCILGAVLTARNTTAQDREWQAREGVTIVRMSAAQITAAGLVVTGVNVTDTSEIRDGLPFVVDLRSDLTFKTTAGKFVGNTTGVVRHRGGFVLSSKGNLIRVQDFSIVPVVRPEGLSFQIFNGSQLKAAQPLLSFDGSQVSWSRDTSTLTVPPTALLLTPEGASLLGRSEPAPIAVGTITMRLWGSDANEPRTQEDSGNIIDVPTVRQASDLTFCEIYGLTQYGRTGDVIGLGVGTTSWNIGSARLDWWQAPDWRHPFIVTNLYRIKDGRFQQIGQSWVKHGFFALSDSQCKPPKCTEHTDGSMLGVGCTDTYSPGTNANQGHLGPRFEINPWEGTWNDTGIVESEIHSEIDRRLQVADEDLDPAQNTGATYLIEAYYVHYQDQNPLNSAAWKTVTPVKSSPVKWDFTMSGAGTAGHIGFALGAWADPKAQTTIAQVVPPVKFQSPDGRCVLGVKTKDLGGGRWHYEYALLNIDMDRQVSGLTVSLPMGTSISGTGSFAAKHHEEPVNAVGGTVVDNQEWTVSVSADAVSWKTSTNPLRWGTVDNFWFDADKAPGQVGVTLGMFKPGAPPTVTGNTTGPAN
jgi:hypothetical protein